MKAAGSSPLTFLGNRILGRAGSVGLAALLLASCSTSSDPLAQLGLVAQPANPYGSPQTQVAEASPPPDSGNYFIVSEDDPELPDEIVPRPSLANGEQPVAVAAETGSQTVPIAVAAAGAPQVDDPVLAARMGADGVYLDTIPENQPAAAAPAPQQPKRRGFFASLFTEPRPEPTVAPQSRPAPQPRVETADASPEAVEISEQTAEAEPVTVASAEPEQTIQPEAPQPTAYLENRPPEAVAPPAPRRRGFLSAFFSDPEPRTQPKQLQPVVRVAAAQPATTASASATNIYGREALPGVRSQDSLYEISRKSGTDDDSDIDLNEGVNMQLAMAPGLARLAPNGLMVQTDRVDVACLKPSLVRVLKAVERQYGGKVVVTSGYRSPPHNARARGARNSLHMYCAAADIQVDGVDKWELAQFLRTMPGRGGVGTYCHTNSVHVDVGPERDWNWRCRRRKRK
ncbi:MAG: D-Ala-D-Ala carboxypeptidase family metallohydrolase [Rhizobiaceae bacterium]